jgi:hypothetical protein
MDSKKFGFSNARITCRRAWTAELPEADVVTSEADRIHEVLNLTQSF